jgi:hypothetical protein
MPKPTAPTIPPPRVGPPAVKPKDLNNLTAQELFDEFNKNEGDPNATLKDKTVTFTGKVHEVGKDFITIDENDFAGLGWIKVKFLPQEVAKMKALKPNDKVKIKGVCKGREGVSVLIEDASLLPNP